MTTANLALQDLDPVIQYTSTGESQFAFPFPVLNSNELKVSIDQVPQVLGVDYTIAGVGSASGGTITTTNPTTPGERVTLWLDVPLDRLTGFAAGVSTLLPGDLNTEFVRRVRIDQVLRRDIGRALRLAIDDPQSGQDMIVPTRDDRAGQFLAFDANGVPIASSGTGNDAALRADLADTAGALLVGIAEGGGLQAFVTRATTFAERTWYVDPATGDDSTGTGEAGAPFATIQRAIDEIPQVVIHQQTIQLADGVHDSNYIPAASLPRAAMVFIQRKVTTQRTVRVANRIAGPIVIRGNIADPTAVRIKAAAGYTDAVIYNTGGQVGLDSLTLEGATGVTVSNLLLSHRNSSYVHCSDVIIEGLDKNETTGGLAVEAGGVIEFTGLAAEIRNCGIGARTLAGGIINISGASTDIHDCNTGVYAQSTGLIKLDSTGSGESRIYDCSAQAILGESGGTIEIRGVSNSFRYSIENQVLLRGATLMATFADFESTISVPLSMIYLDNCGWQQTFVLDGGHARLRSSNSYTTGNTQSNQSFPLQISRGGGYNTDGTVNLVNSAGATYWPGVRSVTINANDSPINVLPHDRLIRLNGNGANRTGCFFTTANAVEGQEVDVFGDTWGVQLIDDSSMTVVSGGVNIGSASAFYQGAKFRFYSGRWREISRSLVRP